MHAPAISIENLSKTYKGELGQADYKALDSLSLTVPKGGVYAFIGPNGAGKTTTIKCMLRLMFADSGEVRLLGQTVEGPSVLERVGYLPEQPRLYEYLTGHEFLDFIGQLFGLSREQRRERSERLLEQVGLAGKAGDLIRGYSRGMMQRLGLAQALINDPALIVLDEPMASLDPVGRKDFRDMILALRDEGRTVFFSSHILSDAELIADRVGMLSQGRLLHEGPLTELLAEAGSPVEIIFDLEDLSALKTLELSPVKSGHHHALTAAGPDEAQSLCSDILKLGGRLVSVNPLQRSLESFFMDQVRGDA